MNAQPVQPAGAAAAAGAPVAPQNPLAPGLGLGAPNLNPNANAFNGFSAELIKAFMKENKVPDEILSRLNTKDSLITALTSSYSAEDLVRVFDRLLDFQVGAVSPCAFVAVLPACGLLANHSIAICCRSCLWFVPLCSWSLSLTTGVCFVAAVIRFRCWFLCCRRCCQHLVFVDLYLLQFVSFDCLHV
jgi:hypothetical protein